MRGDWHETDPCLLNLPISCGKLGQRSIRCSASYSLPLLWAFECSKEMQSVRDAALFSFRRLFSRSCMLLPGPDVNVNADAAMSINK